MVDIPQQVAYWSASSDEDWAVAEELIGSGRVRHGLFFAHLAIEKLLKALVCRATQDLAPRIHSLVRLAQTAELDVGQAHLDVLAELNEFNIEGRYPHSLAPPPPVAEAQRYLSRADEVRQWLIQQL